MSRVNLFVRWFAAFAFLCCHATAESNWISPGARTLDSGRLEIGALSSTAYGVTDRVEVSAHPLGMILFPAAKLKVNWWQGGHLVCRDRNIEFVPQWWVSSQHRLFVPTPLLNFLAKEGSGGLLPANTDVPIAVGMTHLALLSRDISEHLLSLSGGISFSVQGDSDLPMVEFPFLYSTLASLYSPLVIHAGLSAEGVLLGPIDYEIVAKMHLFRPRTDIPWPGDTTPWVYSQETKLTLSARLGRRHRLSLGLAAALAKYPVGTRLFAAPTLDYRVSF